MKTMGRNANVNTRELVEFRNNLVRLGDRHDEFMEACAKEIAARLLAKVVKRTPTGTYPKETGKKGGTLKRGWTVGEIEKHGGVFHIEVINPTEYASYVEYGHRQEPGRFVPAIGKRLKKGWVEGKFMLTISEQEIERDAPVILQKKLQKYLKEALGK